ncbi:MAG: quinolinate synthase NadA [Leptolyngbyaceae cyanobacterium RM2_2_4]|nr:quinolinate synthase NadA [Leptolyngbyaceae cyanobacterium RM2_2_4]
MSFLVKKTIIKKLPSPLYPPRFFNRVHHCTVQTQLRPIITLPRDLFQAIQTLKRDLNAVVLAHYYQDPDIQDIADYIGDSLGLSQQAANTNAEVIVFAGVHFMAETAKVLNPSKLVLLPDLNAGCSLADSCPPQAFAAFKAAHPNHLVVSYINCTAEIKAMSDIICTSSNAVQIVNQIPKEQPIIFAPDRNLGRYVMAETGRDLVLWEGACMVHENFSEKKIVQLQVAHPTAEVIAHPECEPAVLRHASYVGSTTALLKYSQKSSKRAFIVATEAGIIHQMQKQAPDKQFIPAPPMSSCACNECPHMRLNTLEKLYLAMKNRTPEITLPADIQAAALRPIQRMLEMSV